MKFKAGYAIPIILALGLQMLAAQARTISGQVTVSETGEALQGAQVFVKDTYIGSVSDAYGNYSLEVPTEEVTLMVAFIGYKTQELAVAVGEETINFALETDVLKSEQVVVTGIASSVKRRNLAHAVATISAEDLVPAPAQTLDAALSGKFAGISVRQNTGAPGGGMSVNLRGLSTIEGSTQPLYVIDGVIVNNAANQSGIDIVTEAASAGSVRPQGQPTNRIGDINPEDIESIEVLKGASAAAIYGSKATNGVVIIKTKRGKPGDIQFKVTQRFGASSILKKIGYRKFDKYGDARAQYGGIIAVDGLHQAGATLYSSYITEYTDTADAFIAYWETQDIDTTFMALHTYFPQSDSLLNLHWMGRAIDYEDELYGESGSLRETNFSVGGGTVKTRFYASGTIKDEGGIVKNTGYKKYAGLLNLDHQFSDKATLSVSTNLMRTESDRGITGNDNTGTSYGFSLAATPSFLDIRKNSDGDYPDHPNNPSNPLHSAAVLVNNEVVFRTLGSFNFTYNLLQTTGQSLKFIALGGTDYYSQENMVYSPPELQFERSGDQPGRSILANTSSLNSTLYLTLAHNLNFGGNSTLSSAAGLQYETADLNQSTISSSNMVVTQSNVDQSANTEVFQNIIRQQDRGLVVQEELNLNEIVYLSAAIRGDRSSTVGDTEKRLFFPKAAASVRLSELGFWGPLAGLSEEFKIRVAYGQTGNLPVPTAKFTAFNPQNISGRGGLLTGSRSGEPDIGVETTTEIEFGFDAALPGGLGSLEFTMFNQSITDLLLFADAAASSGFTSEVINGGEMETKGLELSLNLNLIRTRALGWNSRINYFTTESEITKLNVDPFNLGGFATFLGTFRIEPGWSPTAIVGSEMQYVWDAAGDSLKPVMVDRAIGDTVISVHQHHKLGDETPDFQMSFNNNLRLGDFSVHFLLDYKKGGGVINLGKLISDLGGTTEDYDDSTKFKLIGGAADGGDTTIKDLAGQGRLALLGTYTDPYIEDGTYLKLRELNITYSVPRAVVQRLFSGSVTTLSVSVTGRNLWMWTKDFASYDPEVSQFGNIAIGSSVDTYAFPSSKSFYFEVSLGF